MNPEQSKQAESADAEKVDAARDLIARGEFGEAERLLLEVIADTPAGYANSTEDAEGQSIKFWDQASFVHYVLWEKSQGRAKKAISAVGNAYPRAFYHMGFLCVKRKQFGRAIEYLDEGQRLEPTNPKFIMEKCEALVCSGRKEEALALYAQVREIGPYVSGHDLAVAIRGQGFVLIEMGRLDDAEKAFKRSLDIEPKNGVALNKLQYIAHLRQGGATSRPEATASVGPDFSRCAVCGNRFTKGRVVSLKGVPTGVCQTCDSKLRKKWWQFWKQ